MAKEASTHQKEWGTRLIDELSLKGDESILDLGCGDGALTLQLADIAPKGRVLGIDGSRSMIETANSHKRDNLCFEVKDINNLDFKGKFDLIFSNATLHWIKDHKKLLNNVYVCLKPNGTIRFNFATDGNCSNLFTVLKEVMKLPKYAKYFSAFEWPGSCP